MTRTNVSLSTNWSWVTILALLLSFSLGCVSNTNGNGSPWNVDELGPDPADLGIRLGRVGDRWLDHMPFQQVARAARDGVFGYEVTYHTPDGYEFTLFWSRGAIDLAGKSPAFFLKPLEFEKGRILYPTLITEKSLANVYRAIQMLEHDYQKQATGGMAAAEAFVVVVTMASLVPGLRSPTPTVQTTSPSRPLRVTGSATSAAAAEPFGALSQASRYGVQPYNQLTKALKGTGLQAHHLIEKRFAGIMGQKARHMASIAVTRAEHQVFTNAWRQAIPYGQGTALATRAQVLDVARQIYANYPGILRALGL